MILRIEEIKDVCSKVLWAVDSGKNEPDAVKNAGNASSLDYRGLAHLYTSGGNLYLAVSSVEYSVVARIPYDDKDNFEAVVDANVFLKLITQITTDTIELDTTDRVLHVKGNGTYNIPMVYRGDALMPFPSIELNNVVNDLDIPNDVFKKISAYNTKQLSLCDGGREIFKYYYFDNHGCITANLGACITKFELNCPLKLLFNQRLVKLFKLFGNNDVHLSISKDIFADDVIQTKVCFSSDDIEIKSILSCDDTFVDTYPVTNVRSLAETDFDYAVVFKRAQVIETLNRIALFVPSGNIKLSFANKGVTFSALDDENSELVYYQNDINIDGGVYTSRVDLKMFKSVLESISSPFVTLKFGSHRAFIIEYDEVKSIIPEEN